MLSCIGKLNERLGRHARYDVRHMAHRDDYISEGCAHARLIRACARSHAALSVIISTRMSQRQRIIGRGRHQASSEMR